MKLIFRFVPVKLALYLVLGILFGKFIPVNPFYLGLSACVLIIVFGIVYFYSNKQYEQLAIFPFFVFLITFLVGISSITFNNSLNKKNHYRNQHEFSLENNKNSVLRIVKTINPNQYYNKYEAEVIQLDRNTTEGKVLLNVAKDSSNNILKVDDQILVNSTFKNINLPKNPYGFNYRAYLKNQQINCQITVNKASFYLLESKNRSIKGLAARFRNKINEVLIKSGFKDNELAVINALLLGQRQTLSKDLMQSYTGAGAIHILAVSGLHVGIILLILTFLFKPISHFKKGKLIASICIISLLWAFAIIAGLSASVVRAVTMFTAVTIGMYSNRPTNIYNTLVISMFFLLLIHPNYLFEVGFQLSYLAVLFIVWVQPKIYNLIKVKTLFFDKVWQLFTVSLAAQIGVLPLSLYYFHQFPGLFFISNLIIIPFLGIILTLGIIVMVLALLGVLPQFLANGYTLILKLMNGVVEWVSNQELFIIKNITFSFVLLIISYCLIVVFFKWFEKKSFKRFVFVLTAVIVFQLVVLYEKYERQSTKEFIVFQKNKETFIGRRNGDVLELASSKHKLNANETFIRDYKVGSGINKISIKNEIQQLYSFNDKRIVVVDSIGIFNYTLLKSPIVLIRNSPKINVERFINKLQPQLIIVDGSNYKSYVENWKKTCVKNKTPFYNTLQNGAYVLN